MRTHHSPSLWTSVVVQPPRLEKYPGFHQKFLSAILLRSGTLELDISIKVPDAFSDNDPLAAHLSRAHTLDVEIVATTTYGSLPPISPLPELNKLRHFYVKGNVHHDGLFTFPWEAQHSPLETFYYDMRCPLSVLSVPTTKLRTFSYVGGGEAPSHQEVVQLAENCKLQMLEIDELNWDRKDIISSSTLTHLDIRITSFLQFSGTCCIIGQLPNLCHLCLAIQGIWREADEVMWPPLPSLRSLELAIGGQAGTRGPYLEQMLQGAPQLVALQIREAEVLSAINHFRAQRDEGGTANRASGASLRLVRVVITAAVSSEYHALLDLVEILHGRRPYIQTECYTEEFTLPTLAENQSTVVLDGLNATPLARGETPSPPLCRCAEEIIGEDGI